MLGTFPLPAPHSLDKIWVIREMHIKTTMIYLLTPTRMARIKKFDINKYCHGCGEIAILVHCWWDCKLVWLLGKTVWWSQKWNRITPWSSYSTTRYRLKGLKTSVKKKPCTWVFIAKLWTFTIAKRCKQPKCSLTNGWINKLRHVHISGILFSH